MTPDEMRVLQFLRELDREPPDRKTNARTSAARKGREPTTAALASLPPRDERVLRMRLGIGMNTDHTVEEVAWQFEATRERIRQIEAKALRRLKHLSRSRKRRRRSFSDN